MQEIMWVIQIIFWREILLQRLNGQARFNACIDSDGAITVSRIVLQHNHELTQPSTIYILDTTKNRALSTERARSRWKKIATDSLLTAVRPSQTIFSKKVVDDHDKAVGNYRRPGCRYVARRTIKKDCYLAQAVRNFFFKKIVLFTDGKAVDKMFFF